MLFRAILLPSVLIPAAVTLIALGLVQLWRSRQRPEEQSRRPMGSGAPAVGLAFCAAYVAMNGWPRFWPVEATQRLFFFVLLTIPASFILSRLGRSTRMIALLVLSGLVFAQLFQSQLEHRWAAIEGWSWIGFLAIITVAAALAWSTSVQRTASTTPASTRDPLWATVIRPLLLGMAAVCLGLSGSALLGQLMGALAVAVAIVEAWQWVRTENVWRESDGVLWSVVCIGLLACGYFYADLQAPTAILLVAALHLLATNGIKAPASRRALCLIPGLIALALTVAAEIEQLQDESNDYDYYGLVVQPTPENRLS